MEKFYIIIGILIIFGLLWYGLYALFGWTGTIIYLLILVLFWQFIKDYKN